MVALVLRLATSSFKRRENEGSSLVVTIYFMATGQV